MGDGKVDKPGRRRNSQTAVIVTYVTLQSLLAGRRPLGENRVERWLHTHQRAMHSVHRPERT